VTGSAKRGLIAFPIRYIQQSISTYNLQLTCEYGTNIKFGHYTFLTEHYFWLKFEDNRLNKLGVMTCQTWKSGKAIGLLFADPVTYCYFNQLCVKFSHAESL